MKEDFELRSNQIKLATARSAKFYDKTTLTMRVRSNTQADEAAKASDSANTVISQGELSCDHALSIRGKNHIRLSALDAMPTTDAEAQMVISAIPGQNSTKESMVCAAMAVSSETLSLGGISESSVQKLSVSNVPDLGNIDIGDITKPDITNPGIGSGVKPGAGVGGIIVKPVPYTRIKIKVACITNGSDPIISSPRYVTVYCLCKGKTYTIKGLLGGDKLSFEETITVMDKVENPLSTDMLKFRWATYGSWSSQTKDQLTKGYLGHPGYPGFKDAFAPGPNENNDDHSCSQVNVITITKVNDITKTVGFNSNVMPLTSHAYSLGDTDHYWTGLYAQDGVKTSSDLRLKKDIKQLTAQDFSAFYDKLRPVSFRFKADDETAPIRLGFIAQDVETALTETGHADLGIVSKPESENGYYGLCYEQFIMLNMLQIKQLKKDLASLQQKYDALEKALGQKNHKEE